MATTRRYRLTRDLPASEPGNFFPRDLKAGEVLYDCTGAYARTNVDFSRGACLTEDPEGGYPGYEVPLSAVEEAPAPAYDEAAHAIFHDEHCRCGHGKGVHAGRDADGRCVLRRCGCGKFEPAPGTAGQADGEAARG